MKTNQTSSTDDTADMLNAMFYGDADEGARDDRSLDMLVLVGAALYGFCFGVLAGFAVFY